jgi:2-haloacid dehalogenase
LAILPLGDSNQSMSDGEHRDTSSSQHEPGGADMNARRYDAVLFDLLSALLDSWTLWAEVAGDPRAARRWCEQYLALTFSTGRYVAYGSLVARAAEMRGLDPALAQRLTQSYGQLRPWPEVPRVLAAIAATMPIGTVTNCSDELGHQAAGLAGVPFAVTVTAQKRRSLQAAARAVPAGPRRARAARRPSLVRGRVAVRHPRRRAARHGCVVAQPDRHARPPGARAGRRAPLTRSAPGLRQRRRWVTQHRRR